jgi:hypothetical protein
MTTEAGQKHDQNKLRWDLLPLAVVSDIVAVLTFGANKYTDDGWRQVPDGKHRYYAALLRHLEAYQRGEETDLETGLSHLAHAGCNLIFLLTFQKEKAPANTSTGATQKEEGIST